MSETQTYTIEVPLPVNYNLNCIRWINENIPSNICVEKESKSHITILCPILEHEMLERRVRKITSNYPSFTLRFGSLGMFTGAKNVEGSPDVLYVGVKDLSKNHLLNSLSKILKFKLPNTNSFSVYHPHVTLAYLSKGTARKLLDRGLRSPLEGKTLTVNSVHLKAFNGESNVCFPLGISMLLHNAETGDLKVSDLIKNIEMD